MRRRSCLALPLALLALLFACTPAGPAPDPTALFVDPTAGDDDNAGTQAQPLRTLTRALELAADGFTITLAPATYSDAAGEDWPELTGFPPTGAPNVPAGVTLIGNGATLAGPGGATLTAALVFAGAAGVRDLKITGFERALVVSSAAGVHLEGIEAHGNYTDGLLVHTDGFVTVVDSTFHDNRLAGIGVFGNASLEMTGGSVHANEATGVFVGDQGHLELSGAEVHGNGLVGAFRNSGLTVVNHAEVELENVELYDNFLAGIEVYDQARVSLSGVQVTANGTGIMVGPSAFLQAPEVRISDSQVDSNTTEGLRWGSGEGGILTARDSSFSSNGGAGLYFEGQLDLADLGRLGDPARNVIAGNGAWQVDDSRPARAATDGTQITITLEDLFPDVACTPFPVTYVGPTSIVCAIEPDPLRLRIQFTNNRVTFFN